MRLLAIAAGGALGALLRYLISGWAQSLGSDRFPWGTLTVNVAGSFLLGVVMTTALTHVGGEAWGRHFLGIGLLGAFTTFSAFSYETVVLLQIGDWEAGAANVLLHLVLGFAALLAGLRLAQGIGP